MFTLAAAPLTQTVGNGGLFGVRSIAAHAAKTQDIGVGVEYAIGDTIRLTSETWIIYDDEKGAEDLGNYSAGDYAVPSVARYLPDYSQFEFWDIFGYSTFLCITASEGNSTDTDDVAGIKVVSGNGTQSDPYKFAVVYKSTAQKITSASVTLNDGFSLNFYVNNINDAAGYTVKLDDVCDEDGTEVALTEKDGRFFATANVNPKDFREDITATLYKDGAATDVTFTSSVDKYLTAAGEADGIDDKTKAMILAAQAYGCAAYEYFNNADSNFDEIYAKYERSCMWRVAVGFSDMTHNSKLYAPTFTSDEAKVSMVLNSKVKLRVYSENGTNENSFGKYSEVAGLTPLSMGQTQIIDGYLVSGYTWVYRVVHNTPRGTKEYNMAKALFIYMRTADKLYGVDIESVSLDYPRFPIYIGDTGRLYALLYPYDATNRNITWEVGSGAGCLSITNDRLSPFSVKYEALAEDTATVYVIVGEKRASCDIYVKKPAVQITSLSLSENNLQLHVGNNKTIYANIDPSGATNKTLKWSSNSDSVRLAVSNDTLSCTVTPIEGLDAVITVRTTDGSNLSAKVNVTVEPHGYGIAADQLWDLDFDDG